MKGITAIAKFIKNTKILGYLNLENNSIHNKGFYILLSGLR